MIVSVSLSAQVCVPDTSNLSDTVIIDPLPYRDTVPGSGIQQKACLNTPYEQIFSVYIPAEINVPGIGGLQIISARLTGISGLPNGLEYFCSNTDCKYDKEQYGCFVIKGTPTGVSPGEFPIVLNFKVKAEVLGEINFTFPNAQLAPGTYSITVLPEGSAGCTASNHSIYVPEIETGFYQQDKSLIFTLISEQTEDIQFSLYDISGRQIFMNKNHLVPGKNSIQIDNVNTPSGIYLYQISGRQRNNSYKILIH
jgi:hypothetical protein